MLLPLLLLLVGEVCAETCAFTAAMLAEGSEPAPGQCKGPMDRVQNRRAAHAATPCGISSLPFFVDGNASVMACGDCAPGSTFVEDAVCSLGEYCADDGRCAPLSAHPLLGAACPFDVQTHSSLGYCGAGLRCVRHACRECSDGAAVGSRGLVCRKGAYVAVSGCSSDVDWGDDAVGIAIAVELLLIVTVLALRGVQAAQHQRQKR